ncbi:MAG TPA: glycosyltransferase, partial [Gemmataceae bacterium]|nr:glycosyltransferase [Gemmataceae bacterium]
MLLQLTGRRQGPHHRPPSPLLAPLGRRHRRRWRCQAHGTLGQADERLLPAQLPLQALVLLRRARIVFNRSIRGEFNKRAIEALAGGALLFQETENCETPALLRDREHCVYYTRDNLETLLEYYLEHEDERRAIAEAGHNLAREYTFEKLWEGCIHQIETELPELKKRQSQRPTSGCDDDLIGRTWQAVCAAGPGQDASLVTDLTMALEREPDRATLANALGLVLSLPCAGESSSAA